MKRIGTLKPIILTSMLLIGVILSTNQSQAASIYPLTPDSSASTTLRIPFNETACTPPTSGLICLDSYSVTCFYDGDQDGYGSATTLISADDDCFDLNESPVDTDCDDDDPMIHPDATEVIGDGVDQDCNGSDAILCYADNDHDGYGSTSTVYSADADCADPGESLVNTDCNDEDALTHPGADECPDDGIDQDCNGSDATICYLDNDLDGYGSSSTVLSADSDCLDSGESLVNTDCDDDDPMIHPDATEVIGDGVDQDCNGSDAILCYADNDHDGYGSTSTVYSADADCADPGESLVSTDCNDEDALIHPGANEIPGDGIDQDCSGADLYLCFLPLLFR